MSATAFDALRGALRTLGLGADDYYDAQRLEQALSQAGYLIVPAGSVREIGLSNVCIGLHVLIVDGLTAGEARDANDIVWRHELRQPPHDSTQERST